MKALSAVADELCLTYDVATMEQNVHKNATSDVLPCAYKLDYYTRVGVDSKEQWGRVARGWAPS